MSNIELKQHTFGHNNIFVFTVYMCNYVFTNNIVYVCIPACSNGRDFQGGGGVKAPSPLHYENKIAVLANLFGYYNCVTILPVPIQRMWNVL